MAKLSQLLLFDPDPRGLDEMTTALHKEGCAVVSSGDPSNAGALLQGSGPPLAVVMLRDSERLGIEFIQSSTHAAGSRNVACVAVGPAKFREPALQAGAACYLSSPPFARDVLDACTLVAAGITPGSPPSPDAELSLKLSDIGGVYYLVRAVAPMGRSIAVEMQRGQRRAELRFIDGNLSSVQVGALAGLAALHRCLLWDEADLRLKFRNVVRRGGQLSMKDEEVIEECDRFLRDFAYEVKDLGVANTVFRQVEKAPAPTPASEVVPLLRLFDGSRDLARVLDESPFRVFDTLTITKQFAATRTIVPDGHSTPGAPATEAPRSGPAALEAWFQRPPRTSVGTIPPLAPAAQPGSSRPSSPFVKVASPTTASERGVPGNAVPRARTITQREHAADRTPVGGARAKLRSKTATSSSAGVARGEIHVQPLLVKKGDRDGHRAGARLLTPGPSVLVDIESLPAARPMAPVTPAPMTAQAKTAAPKRVAVAQPSSQPPSVIVTPPTPPPVALDAALAKTPAPTRVEPAKKKNPSSSSFNAVEADFFEREADLYKGEKTETFEDLDGTGAPRGPRKTRTR